MSEAFEKWHKGKYGFNVSDTIMPLENRDWVYKLSKSAWDAALAEAQKGSPCGVSGHLKLDWVPVRDDSWSPKLIGLSELQEQTKSGSKQEAVVSVFHCIRCDEIAKARDEALLEAMENICGDCKNGLDVFLVKWPKTERTYYSHCNFDSASKCMASEIHRLREGKK